ncbi:hypothetical protein ACP4OV_014760 [Aristida adscensionis]
MAKKRCWRSLNDGKPWRCRRCDTLNPPTKHRFFKLPAFECRGCQRKLKLDFKFNLGEIEVGGRSLIGEVLDQGNKPYCVSHAYSKAAEVFERASNVKKGISPDLVIPFDPFRLQEKFDNKFPGVPSSECITSNVGLHTVLHMGLILRTEGVERAKPAEPYKAADVSTIPADSFEEICEAMADGVTFIATYLAGKRRSHLRYCQIYKSPSQQRIKEKNGKKLGHAVVLVGAGMKGGKKYFYFLNSWGNKFCPRKNKKGETIRAGIGKLRAEDLTKNVVRLHQNETGVERSLLNQSEYDISNYNYLLMMASRKQCSAERLQQARAAAVNSGYVRSAHLDDGIHCDDLGGLPGSEVVQVHEGKELAKAVPAHNDVQPVQQELTVPKVSIALQQHALISISL